MSDRMSKLYREDHERKIVKKFNKKAKSYKRRATPKPYVPPKHVRQFIGW